MKVFRYQRFKVNWTVKNAVTGLALDLTGKTVKVVIQKPDATEQEVNASVDDAAAGQVSYQWAEDALDLLHFWKAKPYIAEGKVPGTVYEFEVVSRWSR